MIMTERQKQAAFVKALLQRGETEEQHRLHELLIRAERDERHIRRAMVLMGVLGMMCFTGLGYDATFRRDFFCNPTHPITHVLGCLGLASLISLLFFLGYWLWRRALSNRLLEDCRRLLLKALAAPASLIPVPTLTPAPAAGWAQGPTMPPDLPGACLSESPGGLGESVS